MKKLLLLVLLAFTLSAYSQQTFYSLKNYMCINETNCIDIDKPAVFIINGMESITYSHLKDAATFSIYNVEEKENFFVFTLSDVNAPIIHLLFLYKKELLISTVFYDIAKDEKINVYYKLHY